MSVLQRHYSVGETLWYYGLRILCFATLFFLVSPLLVVIPLSFNASPFFTFTKDMLALRPEGYSVQWYDQLFTSDAWQSSLRNSLIIAVTATALATALGTLAALGLSRPKMPFRSVITGLLLSPMIVPLIISAVGMFFFFSRLGLQGTLPGVILAHTVLGVPFVVLTVTATLTGFNPVWASASASLGAGPLTTFRKVTVPLIAPGVISGALFAFMTSFDEVVVVLFVGSVRQKTIPWQMFTGLREQISPVILAVATLMILISVLLLLTLEFLRRRSESWRGLSPG